MKQAICAAVNVVRQRPWCQATFLAMVVLAVFLPSISAEISLVDDRPMLVGLLNADGMTLKDIFFPHSASGGYYRPLIGLSFYLDKILWLLDERMLHLENVLLHLCNALLIFLLAREVISAEHENRSLLPLIAALLFGLHPLATESVNWISGRTDLLAGLFVLAAALMLMKYRRRKSILYLASAGFFFLAGVLSKEVAISLVIAAPFLMWPRERSTTSGLTPFAHLVMFLSLCTVSIAGAVFFANYWVALIAAVVYFSVLSGRGPYLHGDRREFLRTARIFLTITGLAVCGIALAVGVRRLAFGSDVGKFGQTLKLIAGDPNYAVSVFLGAIGFYVKKFFFPLPLNLFIVEIDPLYDFIGIGVLLGCALLVARRSRPAGFALAGVFMLLPALPFAFGTIAWTGYAERYAYIAAAFWSVALISWAANIPWQEIRIGRLRTVAGFLLLITVAALAWITFERNIVWKTNTALLGDTVLKAPHGKTVRIMYAYALFIDKRIPEAQQQITIARSLYSLNYDETLDTVDAAILMSQGKRDKAESCYLEAVRRTGYRSENALGSLISFYEGMVRDGKETGGALNAKLAYYSVKLAELTGNPYHFYKSGQYLLNQRDRRVALVYFRKARDRFPANDPYKGYAARIIGRLSQQDTDATEK